MASGRSSGLSPSATIACSRSRCPQDLARYVARKGSIAVNGVSLTVNEVSRGTFAVNLIPHTLANTNLAALAPGDRVNIEIDLVARYVERLHRKAP